MYSRSRCESTINRISKIAALQPSTDQEVLEIIKWQFIKMNIQNDNKLTRLCRDKTCRHQTTYPTGEILAVNRACS